MFIHMRDDEIEQCVIVNSLTIKFGTTLHDKLGTVRKTDIVQCRRQLQIDPFSYHGSPAKSHEMERWQLL